jgi:hypothetical protein
MLSGSDQLELGGRFHACDDDRLRAIVSRYPQEFRPGDWQRIADEFGCGVSVHQLQHQWENYANRALDNRPFTLSERQQVAALGIDHPHEWKWIATQLGNGSC